MSWILLKHLEIFRNYHSMFEHRFTPSNENSEITCSHHAFNAHNAWFPCRFSNYVLQYLYGWRWFYPKTKHTRLHRTKGSLSYIWLQNCEDMISFANDGEQYFEQSDIKKIALLYRCLKKNAIPFDWMSIDTLRLKGNKWLSDYRNISNVIT